VINYFRNHPDEKQLVGERPTATGSALYLAHPIAADPGCLECHGLPSDAPRTLIAAYGSSNGFGWHPKEVIGAQIVSVPMSVTEKIANRASHTLLSYLMITFVLTMLVIDAGLYWMVILPLRKLSVAADVISKGDLTRPEFVRTGQDEIAMVAGSFNRMYFSLRKAMQLLEG
jgi:methyl-accepting chemotaxis protein